MTKPASPSARRAATRPERAPAGAPRSAAASGRGSTPWWTRGWPWGLLAVLAGLVPVSGVFTLDRIFFVRDLALFFWDRHLWLRRSLYAGEWPLWDPHLAAGQSAAADALHQMFLLPVLALRLMGSEVVGFNAWVALPFPLAALGVYFLLRSRFSPAASALGAVTFAASGPVVTTGNFPNLSWSVAALPWVLWAADRCEGPRLGRRIALLALLFAFQAAAGEPVTLAATAALALAMSLAVGTAIGTDDGGLASPATRRARLASALAVAGGLALGGCIAAVQLVPMMGAAADSWRSFIRGKDFWSLHPLALIETVAPNLFGDFFRTGTVDSVPWVKALNVTREGFFYSVYLGPAALALAAVGMVGGWRRAWAGFWAVAGAIGLLAALGGHTPFYPAARAVLPFVGSFRFPVKYLVVCVIATAALAACGWDALADEQRRGSASPRDRRARLAGILVPAAIGLGALLLAGATMYLTTPTARWIYDIALALGVGNPVDSTAFMLRSIADVVPRVLVVAAAVALFVGVAASGRRDARAASVGLYAIAVVDVVYLSWGFNPTCDVRLLTPPAWVNTVSAHPESRFYFGGKMAGTIEIADADAPKDFHFLTHVTPMERRAAFGRQIVMYPGGMGAREMLSYDLAVLWPRPFEQAHVRFVKVDAEARDRFLSRAGVRYRVLPLARGGGRPSMPAGGFAGVAAFDWGADTVRAMVVPEARVVADEAAQLDAMFAGGWDASKTAMLMSAPGTPDGTPGTAAEPGARIVRDRANAVMVEAGVGSSGGYLVLLDSYSPDWQVRVDGRPGTLYRTNLLFRAVRLAPGTHRVEFVYRPRAVLYGAILSLAGLLAAAAVAWRVRGVAR